MELKSLQSQNDSVDDPGCFVWIEHPMRHVNLLMFGAAATGTVALEAWKQKVPSSLHYLGTLPSFTSRDPSP